MNNKLVKPERYLIYQQDLSGSHLQLTYMGVVLSYPEAVNMVKVLSQTDPDVSTGKHSYFTTIQTR